MQKISKNIYIALNILNDNGYEAYLVGGAVRNLLLGLKINDYDITTNASPTVIKTLFHDYPMYKLGEKHGTIVVRVNTTKIDITTFRNDLNYVDHRHPSSVIFTDDLTEDLKRRDFTINALCLDKDDHLIDKFNGVKDLEKHVIRAIGEPKTRFYEDALRILRALRFKAKLGFEIEEKTKSAIFEYKDLLQYISNERKKDELLQILATNNRYAVINEYLEIFNTFIPFKTISPKIDRFSNEYFALAYLLSATSGYKLKELKFSKQEINLLEALIAASNVNVEDDYEFILLGSDPYRQEIFKYLSELNATSYKNKYLQLKAYMVNKDNLKLSGQDLMVLGYQGSDIRLIQDELIELIRTKKLLNKRDVLLKYLETK